MYKLLAIACIILATASQSGCVSYDTVLTNPITKQTYNCTANGFGVIGYILASGLHKECIKSAGMKGYYADSK